MPIRFVRAAFASPRIPSIRRIPAQHPRQQPQSDKLVDVLRQANQRHRHRHARLAQISINLRPY